MRIVIAGSSGFLGSHLVDALRGRGHDVTRLVRREPTRPDEARWDPAAGTWDRDALGSADVVVNLAGSPTLGNPHSSSWARELRESRVTSTRVLAQAVAEVERPPAYLAGNGISYYGDHGSEVLTEESDSRGHALLTEVTREWQAAARPAVEAGGRVCYLRTSPVMDRRAAPLKMLLPLFKAGLGARLGSGRQHMAMVSLRDWVDGVVFLAEHDTVSGPVNLTCPRTPTNAEFTKALVRAVRRPALLPVPSFALQAGAGAMAPELLGSLNVRPAVLEAAGFTFRDPDVEAVVATGLRGGD